MSAGFLRSTLRLCALAIFSLFFVIPAERASANPVETADVVIPQQSSDCRTTIVCCVKQLSPAATCKPRCLDFEAPSNDEPPRPKDCDPSVMTGAMDGSTQTRVNDVATGQPDLSNAVTSGSGDSNITVSSMGGPSDFMAALDGPVWARVQGNWSTLAGTSGDYVLGAVGTHATFAEGFVVGGMVQFDHVSTSNGATGSKGTGWLAGPYAVMQLPGQSLVAQARLLVGKAANSAVGVGGATGDYASARFLAQFGLTGKMQQGKVTVKPKLQASYSREQSEAYTDSLGTAIPSQTDAIAQVTAGFDAAMPIDLPSGPAELTFGAADVWSNTVSGAAAAYEGHRGRIAAGIRQVLASGASLTMEASYDGIGSGDYESIGLDLLFQHRF